MKPIIGITAQSEIIIDGQHTYSLRTRWSDYIKNNGGIPIIIPLYTDCINEMLKLCDGIMIPGGDDINPRMYGEEIEGNYSSTKARDDFEPLVVDYCVKNNVPFLGICRGIQIANVTLGGTLSRDIKNHWQQQPYDVSSHNIKIINNDDNFKDVFMNDDYKVNSMHTQCINKLSNQLEILAVSGDDIIEAVKHKEQKNFLAIQWHPDFMPNDDLSLNIIHWFINAATEYRTDKTPQ